MVYCYNNKITVSDRNSDSEKVKYVPKGTCFVEVDSHPFKCN